MGGVQILLGLPLFSNPINVGSDRSGSGFAPPFPPGVADDLSLVQRGHLLAIGGGVRGIGLLVNYPSAGAREFAVARQTQIRGAEPYLPIAWAQVRDPDGNLVDFQEFTDLPGEINYHLFKVPQAKAGLWTLSFSGGRSGDLIELRAQKSDFWGVRGEMALGVTPTTPHPAYLWIPPSARQVLIGIEAGNPAGFAFQDERGEKVLAKVEPDPTKRVGRLLVDPISPGTIDRLVIPPGFNGAIVIDGAPGVLCPNAVAASELKGGTSVSEGLTVGGPLPARIRQWMVAHARFEAAPDLTFPAVLPEGLDEMSEVLAFGKYGVLNSLRSIFTQQDLDPQSPTFGGYLKIKPEMKEEPNWTNFLPNGSFSSIFEPASIGVAATLKSPLNPVYQNQEVIDRATLAAFSTLVTLPGDNLLHENNLIKGRYPLTHAFFVYQGLAQGYRLLKGSLSPEAAGLWEAALEAVGDKLADHQAFESNQWAHVMRGHLEVYLATGQPRFRGYFERMMKAYLANTAGPASKYGQHPAGYYLEEFGPDGNYDKLNQFCTVSDYLDYRELPDANAALLEGLRRAVEKDLVFSSLYWLPQPDGQFYSPNAFNCRTLAMLGGSGGYPGDYLGKALFPLSASRFLLSPPPADGVGGAAVFTYLANTPKWVKATLLKEMSAGTDAYPGPGGNWVPLLQKGYSLLSMVSPAKIPVEDGGRTWNLPGVLAWNRGGLYGNVFYDVTGADHVLKGFGGGGPTVLWTKKLGSFLSSMRVEKPSDDPIVDPKLLTFSCLYGKTAGGQFFVSGKERSTLQTQGEGHSYTITSALQRPEGQLIWHYELTDHQVELSVQFDCSDPWQELYLNLPLVKRLKDTKFNLSSPGVVTISNSQGSVQISYPPNSPAQLIPSALSEIQRLIIPLPLNGAKTTILFTGITPETGT